MNERMQTKVVGMHLEEGFLLTPQLLEAEIVKRKREGGNVKGFLYCNPNNPPGLVYPRQLAVELMEVCKSQKVRRSLHQTNSKHPQVHFIADEIYALSVFDSSTNFSSVLSHPMEKVWSGMWDT